INEVHDAVLKLYIAAAPLDADHPMRVRPEELAKSTPLSPVTRNWLHNATITVFPLEPAAAAQHGGPKISPYYVRIRFSTGRECRTAGFYWRCVEPEDRSREFVPTMFVPADAAQTMVISQVKPVFPSGADRRDKSAIV